MSLPSLRPPGNLRKNQYGKMCAIDAKKLKELEKENSRLKTVVFDLIQIRSRVERAPFPQLFYCQQMSCACVAPVRWFLCRDMGVIPKCLAAFTAVAIPIQNLTMVG